MVTKHHKFALLFYNPCHKDTKLQIQNLKNAFSGKIKLYL